MPENQYNNKVELSDGTVLVDLTQDTATAGDVVRGKTLHLASGAPATGTLGNATQQDDGLMSSSDKTKLDGIEPNANSYELPTMSETVKGGATLGPGLRVDDGALSLGDLTQSGSGAEVVTDGCAIYSVEGEGWATQDGTPPPDNPGEIEVARGRNLLDALENGSFDSSGLNASSTNRCRSVGYVAVTPGDKYVLQAKSTVSKSVMWTASFYAVDDFSTARISTSDWLNANVATTVPSGAKFMRVLVANTDNSACTVASFTSIQLEHGTTPTSYVPYGCVGLEVTHDGTTTITPIPLPTKGFAGAAKIYKDTLTIDSAGASVRALTAAEMAAFSPAKALIFSAFSFRKS